MTTAPSYSTIHSPSAASPELRLARGRVVLIDDDRIAVRFAADDRVRREEQHSRTCRRAASCLVAAEPGDEVLVALEGKDAGFILAVLVRHGDSPLRMAIDGDGELEVSGKLRLLARDGLSLVSSQAIEATAQRFELSAQLAEAAVQRVTAVGADLRTHFDRARCVAKSLDHVAERWVQRVKRRYQFVAESDQLRAQSVDVRASEVLNLQGKQTVVSAAEVVKVDGDQVHVG